MTVLNTKNKSDHTKAKMFLDPAGGVAVQRYDTLKYKQFDKLTDKQLGFFGDQKKLIYLKMQLTLKI